MPTPTLSAVARRTGIARAIARWYSLTSRRRLGIAVPTTLGLAVVSALGLGFVHSTMASGPCTNSWKTAASGSWNVAGNWTGGIPTSTDAVCIAISGTYTVTLPGAATVASVTVGGSTGTQTLLVGSTCAQHAVLTATIATTANGAITLSNADGCGNNSTLVGTVTNAGTITTAVGIGGTRNIQGALANSGQLVIQTPTNFNGSATTLTNTGSVSVVTGVTLLVSNSASFTNGTGGSITAAGSGNVTQLAGTFTEGAGTTSGTKPVIVQDATLAYTGTGASAIAAHGSPALTGNLAAGQTLSLESTCSENLLATAAVGFTNGGAITLTNGDGCTGNNAVLAVSTGTLTNTGTITTAGVGGLRALRGNVTNNGTVAINLSAFFDGGSTPTLLNQGAVTIADTMTLSSNSSGSKFTNGSGGSVTTAGSGQLLWKLGTLTEGSGTIAGTKPVVVDDATLAYSGSGAGTIALTGASALTGNISAGQNLIIESTCPEHATTTAAAGFTNGGTITLTNGDTCTGNNATLVISAGTLTNAGTITSTGVGGIRQIEGNLTNNSTVAINLSTLFNGAGNPTLLNQGSLTIADATSLSSASSGANFTNGTAGSIATTGSGQLVWKLGTFTEGSGTIAGTNPVVVDDASLTYSGSGSGTIASTGSTALTGSLSAGQNLIIESTCAEHATTTAAAAFTNGGAITLTNGDGCTGNNAVLAVSSGTLTNAGTITSGGAGGFRALRGNLINSGTINVNVATSYDVVATFANQGALKIANGVTLSVPGGSSLTNGTLGSIVATGTGTLSQSGGTFTEAAGTTSGTKPVILDHQTLAYTGTGASTISLRGNSVVTGNVSKNQILSIESSCTEHATATEPGSFSNAGTINLTNGDGCGNNATLTITGAGTLTNTNVLQVLEPVGGTRTLNGSLNSSKTVTVGAGATFSVSGAFTQSTKGTLNVGIKSLTVFGSIHAGAASTVAGTISLIKPVFTPVAGQLYPVIVAPTVTGTFSKESNDSIKNGLYYLATYPAGGVTLVATQATLAVSATTVAPGGTLTVTGTAYPPNSSVTISFTDALKVKTLLVTITTDGSGNFSQLITVPLTAAPGAGSVQAQSTTTGMYISKKVTVS